MQQQTPPNPPAKSQLQRLVFRPKSRNFIVGSVGSGKSTVGCTLLETYRREHPTHPIYIIDPKRRFFAAPDQDNPRLFPHGPAATVHGRREGVTVNGYEVKNVWAHRYKHEKVFVVQDTETALEVFNYLLDKHDVRNPTMLYLDESMVFVGTTRASPGLRAIIQMGREMGIGTAIINQRPAWIDKTFLSESDRLYVGTLFNPEDCKTVASYAPTNIRPRLLDPLPQKHFWLVDRLKPAESMYFKLHIP